MKLMRRIIKKKFRRFWKSVINRRLAKLAARFSLVIFMLAAILSFGKIQGTNSFFMDTASVTGNEVSAGWWIPVLTMSVSPGSPDGDDGWYKTTPCITLTVSGITVGSATIYYEFSNDGDPIAGGTAYSGACVPIPDGNPTHFQAQAVNDLNPDWKSNVESGQFKVDTQDPIVDITLPANGATVSGSVLIKGTVTDDNPKYYSLKIKDPLNNTIYDSGNVPQGSSFTNQLLYNWNTSALANGSYTIELKGRDQAGNEANDSISVNVANGPGPGDVVINEVMWMGSTASAADEWIELRNTTGHSIDIGQWTIENVKHTGNNKINIPASRSISANGFFLIVNTNPNSPSSALNVSADEVNSSISLLNSGNGNLILRDNGANIIDQALGSPDWAAGHNGTGDDNTHKSMERNDTPGGGTSASDWHTCADEHCNDTAYWDSEGSNYGTPGHANLSGNDPSSDDSDDEENTDVVAVQEEPVITGAENAAIDEIPEEAAPADEVAADLVLEGEEPTAEAEDEPQIITKEFDIKLSGKLDVPDGFEAEVSQKMKKIELSGEEKVINDLKDFEIDLAKIEIEKEGKIEITAGDLDLPDGVKVISHESDDVVLEIAVSEKKGDSQNGKKDDDKQDEVKPTTDDAVSKPDSSSAGADQKDEKDDKKDGDGNGSGDKNSNDSKPGDNNTNSADPTK